LAVDDIVGPLTWGALGGAAVGVAPGASQPSSGNNSGSSSPSSDSAPNDDINGPPRPYGPLIPDPTTYHKSTNKDDNVVNSWKWHLSTVYKNLGQNYLITHVLFYAEYTGRFSTFLPSGSDVVIIYSNGSRVYTSNSLKPKFNYAGTRSKTLKVRPNITVNKNNNRIRLQIYVGISPGHQGYTNLRMSL